MTKLIHIDTETGRDTRDGYMDRAKAGVKVPSNYSKPETIDKYIDDHTEEAWAKTSLDPMAGQLVCICFAIDNHKVVEISGQDEEVLLDVFYNSLIAGIGQDSGHMGIQWCGYNVQFDLRFLWGRSVVNKIKPPIHIPHSDPPWKGSYLDLMQLFPRPKRGEHHKLKFVCEALGIPDDGDIDGADVWRVLQEGPNGLERVVEHCRADVERVREIHRRLWL